MTLLYHFPLQETLLVSKVKGTKYSEDDDGVLTAVGEITLDSKDYYDEMTIVDSSKPVTDGIDGIVETLADLELTVSLPQVSGTFKHFAYVSNDDLVSGSITIQSEKNGNPIFQIEGDGGSGHYIFFHAGSWYHCVIANTRLTNDSTNSSSVTWTLLDLGIESIFLSGIDTPFPALHITGENGSVITWNHDIFRVENLLARPVQRLNGIFNDASFVSFWAYINNTWTFVTYDGTFVAFNNIVNVNFGDIFSISLNPFSLAPPNDQSLKILDLKFYTSPPSFQDIFKHPRNPSFGFFQLSHSSNIGIAGNQLDDSLAVFKHTSSTQDQLLANLRIGNLRASHDISCKGNLLLTEFNILSNTEHWTLTWDGGSAPMVTEKLTFGTSIGKNNLDYILQLEGSFYNYSDVNTHSQQLHYSKVSVNAPLQLNSDLTLGIDDGVGNNYTKTITTKGGLVIEAAEGTTDDSYIHMDIRCGNSTTKSFIELTGANSSTAYQYIRFATKNIERMRITHDGILQYLHGTIWNPTAYGSVKLKIHNGSSGLGYWESLWTSPHGMSIHSMIRDHVIYVPSGHGHYWGNDANFSGMAFNMYDSISTGTSGDAFTTGTHYGYRGPYGSNPKPDVMINGHLLVKGDIRCLGNMALWDNTYVESSGLTPPSDDRLKLNEQVISDVSPLLSKLRPQVYDKLTALDGNIEDATFESGLIAQEIWYDCPELRHLVKVGDGGSPADSIETSSDPSVDPDYSSWGPEPAGVNYIGLIPYLIKGFQEQHAEIQALKSEITSLRKMFGSGNVDSV